MTLLTIRRKREFKRNGFLVLHDAMDDAAVTDARRAVEEAVPFDLDDPESLVDASIVQPWDDVEDREPFGAINDCLLEYAEELVGDDVLEPPGDRISLLLRPPNGEQREGDEAPAPRRERGHIDGYGPHFESRKEVGSYGILATVYLDRVEPRGGGFTVWPGSHWHAANYYESHQLESIVGPPYYAGLPGLDEDGEWDYHGSLSEQFDPLEIWGDSGTVVLWHENLLHCGGVNRSANVRMAAIQRFSRTDRDEIGRDARANPWEYWEGMRDVELALGGD